MDEESKKYIEEILRMDDISDAEKLNWLISEGFDPEQVFDVALDMAD